MKVAEENPPGWTKPLVFEIFPLRRRDPQHLHPKGEIASCFRGDPVADDQRTIVHVEDILPVSRGVHIANFRGHV